MNTNENSWQDTNTAVISNGNKKRTCRLCAIEQLEMLDMFDSDSSDLVNKISQTTSIQIHQSDRLPTVLCVKCQKQINLFYEFRINCLKNQTLLLDIYLKEIEEKTSDQRTEIKETQEQSTLQEKVENLPDENDEPHEDESSMKNKTQKSNVKKRLIIKKKMIPTDDEGQKFNDPKLKYQNLLRPCDICGKMIEKSRMENHLNQHRGIQPYICDVSECRRCFYSSYALKNHKKSHHSSTVFRCSICAKPYRLRKSLYNHEQKHKPARYECQICSRRYKNSTYLKEHMRSHTGERPYACQHCEKSFTKSSNLKAHLRIHTKERPFRCTKCGVSYGYNCLLKTHLEKCLIQGLNKS